MQLHLPSPEIFGFTSGIRIIQKQFDGSFNQCKFCLSESSFFNWYLSNISNASDDTKFLYLLACLNNDGCVFIGSDFVAYRDVWIVCQPDTPQIKKVAVMALKRSELKHKLIASKKGWSTKF